MSSVSEFAQERHERISIALSMIGIFVCIAGLGLFYVFAASKNWGEHFPVILTVFAGGCVLAIFFLVRLARHHRNILRQLIEAENNPEATLPTFPYQRVKEIPPHHIQKLKKHSSTRSKIYSIAALMIGLVLTIVPTILLVGTNLTASDLRYIFVVITSLTVISLGMVLYVDLIMKLFNPH